MHTLDTLIQRINSEIAQLDYPASPAELYTPMSYTLEGGGKRIRPVLTLMACELFGKPIESALSAALAVEVFHNFTLLHDDIMDNSATRRGRDAVHVRWGVSGAILSGDLMSIYAYKLLAKSNPEHLADLLSCFNETAIGVCEGQQYDMEFETREEVSLELYIEMIRLKTAVLIGGALRLGAICGGATPEQQTFLEEFGTAIGLAFQIQDDYLDTYADEQVLGKPVGGDILSAKKNFLLSSALKSASEPLRAELLCLLHPQTKLSDSERIERVKAIYASLGIAELTERTANDYFLQADRALAALTTTGVPAERLEPLRELSHSLLHRKK